MQPHPTEERPMLPPMFDAGFEDSTPLGFTLFAGFVVAFIVVVFVVTMVGLFRNWRLMKRQGMDPMTANAQLMAQLSKSQLLAPADEQRPSLEQRLDELESLHQRGRISDEEYAEARRKALTGD
jgi:hypothetical protein